MKKVSKRQLENFRQTVWEHYKEHKRSFPWRIRQTPYRVLVSEIMLQQTQAPRVVEKYKAFLKAFPKVEDLAKASNKEVLSLWSGLGYNRRALYLKRSAEEVVEKYGGKFPKDKSVLRTLSGIGPYTAAAICIFAYNKPEICIETNIRTVFIHHFFNEENSVLDSDILPLVEKTCDVENPREWYAALMDYGTHLKMTLPNPSRKSKHHSKQSKFKGSKREIRGKVLKLLLTDVYTKTEINNEIKDVRVDEVLRNLVQEGLIKKKGNRFLL